MKLSFHMFTIHFYFSVYELFVAFPLFLLDFSSFYTDICFFLRIEEQSTLSHVNKYVFHVSFGFFILLAVVFAIVKI